MKGPDGISDFEGLHSGRCNDEVRLYAFDLLSDDGVDMRDETLQIRKLWLGKLLKRSGDGIIYNDHDIGAIGPRLIRAGVLVGSGRDRVEAPGQPVQSRAVAALDQSQKSEVARDAPRRGRQFVKRALELPPALFKARGVLPADPPQFAQVDFAMALIAPKRPFRLWPAALTHRLYWQRVLST